MSGLDRRSLRCPRDAKELRFEDNRWFCTCGFSFTMAEWSAAPHTEMAEFLYDLARGRVPPKREVQP